MFKTSCCYHTQSFDDPVLSRFDILIAAGSQDELIGNPDAINNLDRLQTFLDRYPGDWLPGWLSYNLKNETEDLFSAKKASIPIPPLYFFKPEHLLILRGNELEIQSAQANEIFQEIMDTISDEPAFQFSGSIRSVTGKALYKKAFEQLQQHIQRGDVYEANLSMEFRSRQVELNPIQAFWRLGELSPTPFSFFFKQDATYLIGASPERFLAKSGKRLISQPIKGTVRRGATKAEDKQRLADLLSNKKEIAENVMIVDLVRNDLTKVAKAASVQVDELRGIYPFRHLYHAISTISCEARNGITATDCIRQLFPAGSMTGAPKIRAMEIIDEIEGSNRGLFAGALGYCGPGGDFDFNVFIRSFCYSERLKSLSFHVGGAITAASVMEEEYQECLLKAKALLQLFGQER